MPHAVETATSDEATLRERAEEIGKSVASRHAVAVDREGRFPEEAISALRQARLLSAYVPASLGGGGCSIQDLIEMCGVLAEHCASTGMIFAMHQIEVACLVHHGLGTSWFPAYLKKVSASQRLIASVTSEVGVGGGLRTSVCAVERQRERFRLTKDATTISYGVQADDLLVTARAGNESPPGDQVLLLFQDDDYQLKRLGTWDALGMRGTCSAGGLVEGVASMEQILPVPFADISAETMVPVSHLLWGAVWTGIATNAVDRAAASVRGEARKKPGTMPPSALRLAEVHAELQAMRASLTAMATEYQQLRDSRSSELSGMAFALRINNLKINASRAVTSIAEAALQICGIHGYKNDSPFSVGRQLRDALSASLMVANDRLFAANASVLLVQKEI
ncbi:MAG TPA: acyl-CoA dehydrogenase family protein [Myxococcaceae bacterium]